MANSNSHSNPQELFIPLTERLKTIPEIFGIRVNEEPEYKVVKNDGAFEIREYGVQTLARVSFHEKDYDAFKEKAFVKLAHYIFSGNGRSENIPMTSPVLVQQGPLKKEDTVESPRSEKNQSHDPLWTMWFILPKKMDLFTAPSPMDPDIHLEERPARTVATVSYSGNNTLKKVKSNKQHLAKWISEQTDFRPNGAFCTAQYDAPFTLPFVKRNEIHVDVIWSH